jgi:hypothetical protein
MKLSKKQKKELMIGGAILVVAGVGYYLYSKKSSTSTPVQSTSATTSVPSAPTPTPIANVATPAPSAPAGSVNITFTNLTFDESTYDVQLYLSIINGTTSPISLTQIVGTCNFANVPAVLVVHEPPMFDGTVGNVNWPLFDGKPYDSTQIIQPGSSYTRWFPVEVQETAIPHFALQVMQYMSTNNPNLNPFTFKGYAMINGQQMNFTLIHNF